MTRVARHCPDGVIKAGPSDVDGRGMETDVALTASLRQPEDGLP